jgi:hypothetical protein
MSSDDRAGAHTYAATHHAHRAGAVRLARNGARVGRRGQRSRQRRFVWCCAAAARSVLVRACLPPRPLDNGPARADACDAADRRVPRRAIPWPLRSLRGRAKGDDPQRVQAPPMIGCRTLRGKHPARFRVRVATIRVATLPARVDGAARLGGADPAVGQMLMRAVDDGCRRALGSKSQ